MEAIRHILILLGFNLAIHEVESYHALSTTAHLFVLCYSWTKVTRDLLAYLALFISIKGKWVLPINLGKHLIRVLHIMEMNFSEWSILILIIAEDLICNARDE